MSNNKMKVAVVIERYDISLGGAERLVFELAAALTGRGIIADVLAAKGEKSGDNVHILCREHGGKRTPMSLLVKALRQHLGKNRYDIVHSVIPVGFEDVYQPPGGSFVEAAIRNAASYSNRFFGAYKRLTAFANLRRAEMLSAEKRLCKNPRGPIVAALSNYVKDQFKIHYGLEDNRIALIPNGVCPDANIDAITTEKLRLQIFQNLKIEQGINPVFFLFAANNFRLKGLYPLIQALGTVSRRRTLRPVYLIVAGSDRPDKWRHLAEKHGIADRAVFLGPVKHIGPVLPISDAGILPTFYDPSSRFILEVIAASKPVITTRFNGAADLFSDNRHGKVIDSPENITALAEAIGYFSDTNNIQKASQAIIADNLKEKISISRVAKQMEGLYESILKRRR